MSRVCIHGLGYIGLPTAAILAVNGFEVFGYDVDAELRSELRRGDSRFEEPGLHGLLMEAIDNGSLHIVDTPVTAEYQLICVPTPLDREERRADLSYVIAASDAIATRLRPGDTVILESTVPPGTTTDVVAPRLEAGGLTAAREFSLAHCPETVLPGKILQELRENDRLVGGIDGTSTDAAVNLYRSFVAGDIRTVVDPTVAEFAKLAQNTYRDVNIALANEFARLARDYEIDTRETIEMANTHPRVEVHQPGPGVGGHCLPVDPWFLGQSSDQLDLVATARAVNDGMSRYIIDLLHTELGSLEDRRIAVLGVAYKGNVGDTRMSPGLKLIRELGEMEVTATTAVSDGGMPGGIEVTAADPHVTDADIPLIEAKRALAGADAAVITADHDEFRALDPHDVGRRMAGELVLDTKGILDQDVWQDSSLSFRRL